MEKIISIQNMTFSYEDNKLFNKFNLDVKKGDFLTLVGPNGSGKSTLIRIILGFIKTSGKIIINNLEMNDLNVKKIVSNIGVVFENPDNQFVAETVMDDIAFSLENKNMDKVNIKKSVLEIASFLGIEDILNKEPHSLSGGQKQLVALASALVSKPNILILDEAFAMIDNNTRNRIYSILKELNKKEKLTIINVTHDMDESIYGNRIVALSKGKVKLDGKTLDVLKQERELTKLGLSLPFMVDLSIKLKYYGLVDEIILDMDKMVDILWK